MTAPVILPGVVTVTKAAARHDFSDSTVRRAVQRGEIPGQMIGKVIFVRQVDVDRWAESRKQAS